MKQANNNKGNSYYSLLSNFPKLTSKFTATLPPKHSVRHHMCTNGIPIYSEPHRLLPENLKQVQTEFNSMLRVGMISRTKSRRASLLHEVKKLDGLFAFVVTIENETVL